jgi:hypothetical protein
MCSAFSSGAAAAAAETRQEPVQVLKSGTITGRVLAKGGVPLSWGEVMFYDVSAGPPPRPDLYERTPDISKSLDADGRFKVTVPPGKYYLGAVKRMSGERFGPPREGDYVLKAVDDKGKPLLFDVKAGAELNVGKLPEAVPVDAKDLAKRAMTTGIQGVVVDVDGNPISDAVVLAFVTPSLKGRPIFISDTSGIDGIYHLRLTEGTYYLRVRNSSASGPPEPGQIVGHYGDGSPEAVTVKTGEIKSGIDFRVVLFGGRGPRSGEQ